MKSNFYNLIFLTVLQICLFAGVGYSQCTDIIANGGAPWTDFETTFPVAPCDNGTGCSVSEITAFEVFAAEGYTFLSLIGGIDYTFSMCNGPGAGAWVPDFAVLDPTGEVITFGAGDGDACSITFTATTDGTYTVIINEAEACGALSGNQGVGNGFPALTCVNGPACEVVECEAGQLLTTGMACAANGAFDLNAVGGLIPDGGSFGWAFSDAMGGTGGLAGGFSLTGAPASTSYDADLNGVLSANGLPPLAGIWLVTGFVDDANGTTCSVTTEALTVDFDLEGPVLDSLTQTGANELTVVVSGGAAPYTYLWDDANAQTTATATGLDNGSSISVIVTDDNGCQVFGFFDFDPEVIVCSAGTLTTIGDVAICDVADTFDLVAELDTLPAGGQYIWAGSDILGGTGAVAGGFNLTNSTPNVTFDSDLSGILSANGLAPLSGAWVFRGLVADAAGNLCSTTADSLIVRFGTESPAIVDIVSNGIDELTVNATGGVEPYSYLWSDGQTTQTAVGLVPDVYTVLVVDANGCLVEGESNFTVSANSIASLNNHSITPNPNNGTFSVQLDFDNSQFVEVEVLDITGRVVEKIGREVSASSFDFNLNNNSAGIYFVRIIAGTESLTERIVVSK